MHSVEEILGLVVHELRGSVHLYSYGVLSGVKLDVDLVHDIVL